MQWRRYTLTAVAAAGLLWAACGDSDGGGGGGDLVDTSWLLDQLQAPDGDLRDVLAETVVSADFAADRMTGLGGCNSYFGSYEIDGDGFAGGPFGSTERACLPDAVMEQESRYLALLGEADRWVRDGDRLELRSGSDVLLVFSEAQPAELSGSSWTLTFYNNQREALVSVMVDSEVTLTFAEDGTAAGSAGCNNYTAPYEASDTDLTFGPVGSTRRLCDPPELMEQEGLYLANLELVATYEVRADGILDMFDAGGMRLLSYGAP